MPKILYSCIYSSSSDCGCTKSWENTCGINYRQG